MISLNLLSQVDSYYVQTYSTEPLFETNEDSHYVAFNPSINLENKLFVFIGGTYSKTKNSTYLLDRAAELGFHAMSIAYPNNVAVQSACGNSADEDCHWNFRQEICYGTPLSNNVNNDSLNCLSSRIYKLLAYLDVNFPSQNWGQYIDGEEIVWSKIITGGHSQGAGHALYFAKTQNIDRCLMFSGANDYSNYYNTAPNWISDSFITDKSKIFSFLHLRDGTVPFETQYQIIQSLGLTTNDDTTLVDSGADYQDSHLLYTNKEPRISFLAPFHNATALDNWTPLDNSNQPLFLPVWDYMLTDPIINDVNTTLFVSYQVFPNPFQDQLTIALQGVELIQLYNSLGQIMLQERMNQGVINTSELERGIYFLKIGSSVRKLVKQ